NEQDICECEVESILCSHRDRVSGANPGRVDSNYTFYIVQIAYVKRMNENHQPGWYRGVKASSLFQGWGFFYSYCLPTHMKGELGMFPISPKHNPSIVEAIIFLLIIIGEISYFIIQLGVSPHIPITIGIFILLAYGLFQRISFKDLEEGMIFGAKSGMGAVFLFLLIGVLISSWMISGTIPALIAAG